MIAIIIIWGTEEQVLQSWSSLESFDMLEGVSS